MKNKDKEYPLYRQMTPPNEKPKPNRNCSSLLTKPKPVFM